MKRCCPNCRSIEFAEKRTKRNYPILQCAWCSLEVHDLAKPVPDKEVNFGNGR